MHLPIWTEIKTGDMLFVRTIKFMIPSLIYKVFIILRRVASHKKYTAWLMTAEQKEQFCDYACLRNPTKYVMDL